MAEKKQLTIKEWEDFREILQGSEEDLEIVISNLRNLNVDLSDTRFHVITDTDHRNYGLNAEVAIPFKKLDDIINESYSDDHNVRTLFNRIISEHWSTIIPQNTDWDFLKSIEVKVET